ncbi:hypothetical protein Glove_66g17 [Diversispora epigaea]|uniref:Uncharacterized protein n=1 Tax=Diversispora epigaea TaxID=1348612 RepID=A0A397JE04_9GLOM|nr:hypothetical protein Glove_66g17 [Diversispora epigaea]
MNYTFFINKSLSKLICSLVIGKLSSSIRWFVNRAEDLKETSFVQFCGCETDGQLIDVMNRLNKHGIKLLSVETDLSDEGS